MKKGFRGKPQVRVGSVAGLTGSSPALPGMGAITAGGSPEQDREKEASRISKLSQGPAPRDKQALEVLDGEKLH